MYGLCHSNALGSLGDIFGWIGWILIPLLGIGFMAGLALLVFLAVRRARVPAAPARSGSGKPANEGANSANEILKARYARGEINREQYVFLKNDMGQ